MAGRYQEQHPIPQNISSYQFRLVGDMTLKQFFQVAGGALVALLIYSTELVPFVKWPLMFVSFLFGVALAFFPLEDRPLEKWIVLFFKAIYSPTKFKWTKSKHINYFADEGAAPPSTQAQQPVQLQPEADSTKTAAPVGMHKEATTAQDELETTEQEFLTNINQQMTSGQIQPPATNTPITTVTTEPMPTPNTQDQNVVERENIPSDVEQIHVNTQTPKSQPEPQPEPINEVNVLDESTTAKAVTTEDTKSIPAEESNTMPSSTTAPTNVSTEQTDSTQNTSTDTNTSTKSQFAPDVTEPITPTRENLVVGQVIDTEDNVIENAILEIRDSDGRPARALKTNKLGHYGIVTPLSEGTYEMTVEKDGYEFDPITLEVKDEIIEPIAIRAKSKFSNKEE